MVTFSRTHGASLLSSKSATMAARIRATVRSSVVNFAEMAGEYDRPVN